MNYQKQGKAFYNSKGENMDLKRILTTIIGLPIVILAILLGNKYVMGIIALAASIICMYEYFNVIKKVSKPIQWVGYLSNILIVGACVLDTYSLMQIIVYGIPFVILLLFLQVILTDMKTTFKDVAYTLVGIFYIPFFLMFMELIRCMDNGKILIGYTFVISWSTDIAAYLIGKKFGKHKFSKVSPKKSVEGAIAGIVGSILVSLIYTFIAKEFWQMEYSYLFIAIISGLLSIISQIGDFAASSIKRFVDTKDYGNLLPGHGGMLDRIDSLLFLAPFAYLIFLFV